MIEIFHVSDLHFGKKCFLFNQSKKSFNFIRRLDANFKISTSEHKYLLVTGDIVDAGSREFYQIALDALKPFKGKIYFVPGNHDYSARKFPFGFFYDQSSAINFDIR